MLRFCAYCVVSSIPIRRRTETATPTLPHVGKPSDGQGVLDRLPRSRRVLNTVYVCTTMQVSLECARPERCPSLPSAPDFGTAYGGNDSQFADSKRRTTVQRSRVAARTSPPPQRTPRSPSPSTGQPGEQRHASTHSLGATCPFYERRERESRILEGTTPPTRWEANLPATMDTRRSCKRHRSSRWLVFPVRFVYPN